MTFLTIEYTWYRASCRLPWLLYYRAVSAYLSRYSCILALQGSIRQGWDIFGCTPKLQWQTKRDGWKNSVFRRANKRHYLLTLQVSRYCLLALHSSIAWYCIWSKYTISCSAKFQWKKCITWIYPLFSMCKKGTSDLPWIHQLAQLCRPRFILVLSSWIGWDLITCWYSSPCHTVTSLADCSYIPP